MHSTTKWNGKDHYLTLSDEGVLIIREERMIASETVMVINERTVITIEEKPVVGHIFISLCIVIIFSFNEYTGLIWLQLVSVLSHFIL